MQQCPATQRIYLPIFGGLSSCHSCDIKFMVQMPLIHSLDNFLLSLYYILDIPEWSQQQAMFSFFLDLTVNEKHEHQTINNCDKSYIGKVRAAVGQAQLYRKGTHTQSAVSGKAFSRIDVKVETQFLRKHVVMLQKDLKAYANF